MTEESVQLNDLFPNVAALPAPDEALDATRWPACGGVYAITDDLDQVILAVTAGNIRRSVRTRLAPPPAEERKPRADLRAVARTLWWKPAYSAFESAFAYLDLSRRLWPDDYRDRLGFAPAWFASIHLADSHPRWKPTTAAFQSGTFEIGPFSRRSECTGFITLLEDMFDLCRYHHILEQAPRGAACAYFDMGQCPAPCDGSIPMARYRDVLASSANFATGSFDVRLTELNGLMTDAAGRRDYARAARFQELIARARVMIARHAGRSRASIGDASDSRMEITMPEQFRYVIVQRGERPRTFKCFTVDQGVLHAHGDLFPLADAAGRAMELVRRFVDRNVSAPTSLIDMSPGETARRSECIWLIAHFLAKGDRAGGVFLRATDCVTPDNLVHVLREKFGDGGADNAPNAAESIDSP